MYTWKYIKVFENNLHKNTFLLRLQKSIAIKLISTSMISLDYLQLILKLQVKQNASEMA